MTLMIEICTMLRAGFHGGPGPSLSAFSKWGGPGGGPGPPGLHFVVDRLGGPGPPPGPPHFENTDKEGSRSWTSMETCPKSKCEIQQLALVNSGDTGDMHS